MTSISASKARLGDNRELAYFAWGS